MPLVQAEPSCSSPPANSGRLRTFPVIVRRRMRRLLAQWVRWLGEDDTALLLHIAVLVGIGMSLA